jgi:hypothetical protein
MWNVLLVGAIVTVAMPFIAWKLVQEGQSFAWLLPVVAVPVSWWYLLVRTKYRMELTDSHLTLHSLVGPAVRIPLDEVGDLGAPGGRGLVRVGRRDGTSWPVLAGAGLVEFVDEVGRAVPDADVRLSSMERRRAPLYRLFGDHGGTDR